MIQINILKERIEHLEYIKNNYPNMEERKQAIKELKQAKKQLNLAFKYHINLDKLEV